MPSHWLTVRQARDLLRADRPDDAHRLLTPLVAAGHRAAGRALRELAAARVRRAERFLRADQPDAAWAELLAAEGLSPGDKSAARVRDTLTRYGLAVVRAALEAGRPPAALDAADQLAERGVRHPDLGPLVDAAHEWVLAAETADRGDFLQATAALDRIRPRLGCPPTGLDRFAAGVAARHEQFRCAVGELSEAVDAGRWRDATRWADQALAAAPAHRETRVVRRRAWDRLHPPTEAYQPPPRSRDPESSEGSAGATRDAGAVPALPSADSGSRLRGDDDDPPLRRLPSSGHGDAPPSAAGLPKRFVLWANGAGGYLVCLGHRVTLGQAAGDGPIDVPLLADVARLHVELTRDAEGYVLETRREVAVNGVPVTRTALRGGDRVTLGPGCQFVFHIPAGGGPSARLEFVGGYPFPLAVVGVLLMAEAVVLGGPAAHVPLPDVAEPVVLYRGRDGLGVAAPGAFRVENRPCQDRAAVPVPGWVHGDDWGFGLEPVGR